MSTGARAALVALAVALAAGAAPASSALTVLLGDQAVETGHDSNTAGRAEAFRTTATGDGTVTKLTVYVDSGSAATALSAGLYADAAGRPGALLGDGSVSIVAAGAWNDVPIAPVRVTGGQGYWIAILSPTGTGTLEFRDSPGTGNSETSLSEALSALPATWESGPHYSDGPLSAYGAADLAPEPILQVAPAAVSLAGQVAGTDPAVVPVSVQNGGGGSLDFTATSDAAWLTVAPAGGTAPQTLHVGASLAGLSAGTYTGTVTVTAVGVRGSPATVKVTLSVVPQASPSPFDWPTVDHDSARTGDASGETTIGPANARTLKAVWSAGLDGKVTAQPLFLKNVTVGGQAHDIVIAATSANSVYALDAGSGAVLWRANFGAQPGNCAVPGGFGVTGAPVADKVSGRIYTVAEDGSLHTLSIADGTDAVAAVQVIPAPATNKVWGGLNLVGADLYVATASDGCDTLPWQGRVYRVGVGGAVPQVLGVFDVVPPSAAPIAGGGVWGYGGVSADSATGTVFAASGADSTESYTQYADRMIALDRTLGLLGSFLPTEPGTFPCTGPPCDLDFGATPVVFQPAGCPLLTAAGNKNGFLYVFRASDLAAGAAPLQSIQLNPANDWLGSGGVGGVPAYWSAGQMLYVSDTGPGLGSVAGGLVALSVQPDCTLALAWSAAVGGNATPDSTPTVANGVVYVGEGSSGAVRAFDAKTGAPLWSSGPFPGSATYAAPIVADGKLIFGSWDGYSAAAGGTIRAYAPTAPDTTPPTVSITSPANGARLSGSVNVTAAATDDVGVASVQVQLDGVGLGGPLTSAPYTVAWDTTTAAAGTHVLTAVARDTAGNTAVSNTVTATVDNSIPPPVSVLLGDQTVGDQADSDAAGRAEAFQTTAAASGTISQVNLYLDTLSSAIQVIVGIYADEAGHPGALVAQGATSTPTAGAWNEIPLAPVRVAAGTTYWIAILDPFGPGLLRFRDRPGGTSETSAADALTSLPASWTTGASYSDGPLSAYGLGG